MADPATYFEDLIAAVGSKTELARALGVTPQQVSQWSRRGFLPAHYAEDVERLTGGGVTAMTVIRAARANLDKRAGPRDV